MTGQDTRRDDETRNETSQQNETAKKIEVPAHVRAPKPIVHERSHAERIAREIKELIRTHGRTRFHPIETFNKPPPDAVPVYLEDVTIPAKFAKRQSGWSPCPCCAERHPKFKKCRISWFPAESLIRVIGLNCFASLNPEGHERAVSDQRRRKREQARLDFIFDRLHRLLDVRHWAEDALLIAREHDRFQNELTTALASLRLPLGDHVTKGVLKSTVSKRRVSVGVAYSSRPFIDLIDYARIEGWQFRLLAVGSGWLSDGMVA